MLGHQRFHWLGGAASYLQCPAQKAGGIINHKFINTLKSSSKFLIGERDPKWELGVNMEKLAVFKEEFSENSDI